MLSQQQPGRGQGRPLNVAKAAANNGGGGLPCRPFPKLPFFPGRIAMRAFMLTAVVTGILVASNARAGDAKKDKEALQGTWKVETTEQGGQSRPDNDNFTV